MKNICFFILNLRNIKIHYNMRTSFSFLVVILGFITHVTAQCVPNPLFTMSPIPGVYPPNIPIPNIPLVGISDGQVNTPYSETLTLVVLEDTSLDVGFLLPAAVVTAMNVAGISTVMTVDVNHVSFDVTGLPNNLTYTCDIANCQYPSSTNGCIALSGTPVQNGTFPVDVNMLINIQIPSISDPIFGTQIFAGMAVDLPSFPAQQYDLFIDGSSAIEDNINTYSVFPNPTSSYTILEINEFAIVEIYDILGKQIKKYNNIQGSIRLTKSDLGTGLFYIIINDEEQVKTERLIIK